MRKEYYYDTVADQLDSMWNMYDVTRRIEVVFDDFLGGVALESKTLLDAGCGTGFFTLKAIERGAHVTAIDIAENLVKITNKKTSLSNCIVGSLLNLPFKSCSFDIVISSEVIEHTDDPFIATDELIRVLKPEGLLCITVPNKSFWYFSLILARLFKLRSFQGNENWLHYRQFKKYLLNKQLNLLEYKGIHLFPFIFQPLNVLLRRLDKIFDLSLGPMMVNIAAFAQKGKAYGNHDGSQGYKEGAA